MSAVRKIRFVLNNAHSRVLINVPFCFNQKSITLYSMLVAIKYKKINNFHFVKASHCILAQSTRLPIMEVQSKIRSQNTKEHTKTKSQKAKTYLWGASEVERSKKHWGNKNGR